MARGRYIALLVSGALGGAACTSATTGKPLGAGDHVFVDVEASTLPPQPDADLDPDGTFARVDSSAIETSWVYPTRSKFDRWTLSKRAVAGPVARA